MGWVRKGEALEVLGATLSHHKLTPQVFSHRKSVPDIPTSEDAEGTDTAAP